MKIILTVVFTCLLATPMAAQDTPRLPPSEAVADVFINRTDVDLKQFVWKNRPLVVFADSPNDPRFVRQMEYLRARVGELAERDVVVLTDTDPGARSALREQLRPRGFVLVLIVKDGTIYLRKPNPWDVREISSTIDKLPMRQQEIEERREQRNTGGAS